MIQHKSVLQYAVKTIKLLTYYKKYKIQQNNYLSSVHNICNKFVFIVNKNMYIYTSICTQSLKIQHLDNKSRSPCNNGWPVKLHWECKQYGNLTAHDPLPLA